MPTETITIKGEKVLTLKELLCPGLRAVFVGINPTPISVELGHYNQSKLGKRFWNRLQNYGFTSKLSEGKEDEAAYREGFGFADLVRRPTKSADVLTSDDLVKGTQDLVRRLAKLGEPRPAIVFVFKTAFDISSPTLRKAGFQIFRMPGPYAKREDVDQEMLALVNKIVALR